MKSITVTKLESKVLTALAEEMYAEPGYSSTGLEEVVGSTGLTSRVVRGVASSLIQKGLLEIDRRENEWGINPNDTSMHIWYLRGDAWGLVPNWIEDDEEIEPAQLIVK